MKTSNSWAIAALAAIWAVGPARAGARPTQKRLIATFKEGTSRADRERAARGMGLRIGDDLDAFGISVLETSDVSAFRRAEPGSADPNIETIEEDVYRRWLDEAPVSFQGAPFPDVENVLPSFAKPKARPDDGAPIRGRVPWGVARVNAPAAWASGRGEGVKIAVVDTGVDCAHPDLRCDFRRGVNIVDPGSDPADDNEHGTHVSGTIAGRGDDGGVLGVAPRATLLPVKVLDADGGGTLSDIIKGLDWAVSAGADVVNMSLGGDRGSPALQRAVRRALESGVVVVCAAGNSGPDPDTVGYPAGYPGVIAVAASDSRDRAAVFSSRGDAVGFIAPGVGVLSTVPGGGYAVLSGTSMASPHVAGLAALAIGRGAKGPAGVRRAFAAAAAKLCAGRVCQPASAEGAGMIDAAKLR